MTQLILFNVFNGLIIGAFYALMALGLSLILNLSGVINFAHGGFLAVGGYLAYVLIPFVGFWGALLISPFLTAFIGLLVERLLIRRLYGRDPLYSLLLTFGLAYIFEDGTRFIWGAQSVPYQVPEWLMRPLSTELFFLTGYRVFMVILVGVAVAGLFLILNRTRLGMRIRAGTLDLETVSVLGVNERLLRTLNFGIGIYLAGLAGVLAAGMLGLSLLGGLLIGVASGLTAVFFPSASEAVIYIMMGVVLLVRPRGLLGEEGRF
jgi:branched-chain amino acid transport system permease protein